jgi:hypothetical protein
MKVNVAGSALVYSTYLGGSVTEWGQGIAVDGVGNAYISGWSSSNDFPTTPGAFQTTYQGGVSDAFVTKLNPAGSALVFSTYLGGTSDDWAGAIAIDASGRICVAGSTTTKPTFPLVNPLQATYGGAGDAFVSQLNPAGSALTFSTYLGGSGLDQVLVPGLLNSGGIALDSSGNMYVLGSTKSTDFPTMNPYQATNAGVQNLFITKLAPTVSAVGGGTGTSNGEGTYGGSSGPGGPEGGDSFGTGFSRSGPLPIGVKRRPTLHGPLWQRADGEKILAQLPPGRENLPWPNASLTVLNVSHRPSPAGSQPAKSPSDWVLAGAALLVVLTVVGLVRLIRPRLSSNRG